MSEKETVLVIKPIHDAQKKVYHYKPVEVPIEAAEMQLAKDDKDRNFHWQGVRLANEKEQEEYYNRSIAEDNVPQRRGRKPKESKEE